VEGVRLSYLSYQTQGQNMCDPFCPENFVRDPLKPAMGKWFPLTLFPFLFFPSSAL